MSTPHPNADGELRATRQRRRVATRRAAHFRLASVTAVETIGVFELVGGE
jgi:hypothetical protein